MGKVVESEAEEVWDDIGGSYYVAIIVVTAVGYVRAEIGVAGRGVGRCAERGWLMGGEWDECGRDRCGEEMSVENGARVGGSVGFVGFSGNRECGARMHCFF